MNQIPLGRSDLKTSRLAYGCWRIAGQSETGEVSEEKANHGAQAVVAAYEAGYRCFDLADIYGGGICEHIFGQVLKHVSGMREQITLATKCGIRKKGDPDAGSPYRYDFSAEHILHSCEASLKRLGTDHVDLFMLHRPDYLASWEEVAGAFRKLKKDGKARYFGVSNFRPTQVNLLRKALGEALVTNQIEISLGRIDSFHDGTLDQCQEESMVPMAWSPLGGGRIASSGPIDMKSPDHAKRAKVRETLDEIARAHHVSRSVVALAWLLEHPANILPIVGTTNFERIQDAAKAPDLRLSRTEWYRLMEAANGQRLA